MKDMGIANVIFGVKLNRTNEGIRITQSHYIEKILKRFDYLKCKPVRTPYGPSIKLKKNYGESVSQLRHSQIIRSLMYLANCSRPDIFYIVGRPSRYTSNPDHSR